MYFSPSAATFTMPATLERRRRERWTLTSSTKESPASYPLPRNPDNGARTPIPGSPFDVPRGWAAQWWPWIRPADFYLVGAEPPANHAYKAEAGNARSRIAIRRWDGCAHWKRAIDEPTLGFQGTIQ